MCAPWLLLCIALFGAVSLRAQTNVLTNANADLQAALDAGGTVILNFNGSITAPTTYNIQTDVILETLTNQVTISGGGTQRLFLVQPGVTFQLQNLTLSGGRRAGTNGPNGAPGANHANDRGGAGGAGGNGGTARGGAIYNMGTTLAINCLFLTNSVAGGNGGAGGTGGASVDNLPGDGGNGGNGGIAFGGAVYNEYAFYASNCTFSANSAVAGNGGVGGTNGTGPHYAFPGVGGTGGSAEGAAIYNDVGASATILACTFAFNFCTGGNSQAASTDNNGNGQTGASGAAARGGAIYNASPNQNFVVNSTFYDNLVAGGNGGNGGNAGSGPYAGTGGNGGNGQGGSIFNDSTGYFGAYSCTFDAGQAFGGTNGVNGTGAYTNGSPTAGAGYGANIANNGGTFILQNSILAYPTNAHNASGSISDGGFNLSSDNTPVFNNSGSRNSVNPLLGPLANNGGPTQTIMPAANSPAVGAITDGVFPPFDQRGVPRPIGQYADIGAVERGGMLSGKVTFGTNGVADVNITVSNQLTLVSTTTDASGNYSFALPAGIYTVTPQLGNYVFNPSNSIVTVSVSNFAVANFSVVASPVKGTVTMDSNGLANVTITATGTNSNSSFTATTDTSGNYSLNLPNGTGTYTITPALATLVFNPSNRVVTASNSSSSTNSTNSTNVNFTTTAPAFFSGEARLSNDYFWLSFTNNTNAFGYYTFIDFPTFYHIDLGYEYFFDDTNNVGNAYFYDFQSTHFFYTGRTLWPYLYDFNLSEWLYYFPNQSEGAGRYSSNPRYFGIVNTTNVITE